jgi:hypothetical protein
MTCDWKLELRVNSLRTLSRDLGHSLPIPRPVFSLWILPLNLAKTVGRLDVKTSAQVRPIPGNHAFAGSTNQKFNAVAHGD